MEKSEQRFVVKFFFLKSIGCKIIHRKLTTVLGSTVCSSTQIKELCARFKAGDLSCEDKFRPGRPLHVLVKALSDFLEDFPFAIAKVITSHFNQSKSTIKEILQWEPELQRFSRRWVPHSFSDAQKSIRQQW
jgi:hypothetical protein